MWGPESSSSTSTSARRGRGQVKMIEQVEKHLDLTNYLNFLQNLFSLSTSDSETSDVEGVDSHPVNNITKSSLFTLSKATTATSVPKKVVATDELIPLSDLELNNLLPTTNYLDVELDPSSFDLDEDPDSKQKKKKSKKKKVATSSPEETPRQDRPNSGGRGGPGPGPGSSYGSSFNGTSESSSSRNSSHNNGPSSGGGGSGKTSNHGNSSRKQSLAKKSAPGNCSLASEPASLSITKHSSSSNFSSGLQLELLTFSRDSGDDNDSLSDYLSMAATAAGSSRHLCLPPVSSTADNFMQDDDQLIIASEDETSPECVSLGSVESLGSGSAPRGIKRRGGVAAKDETVKRSKLAMGQKQAKFIELMNLTRKNIYVGISKKEVPKEQRTMTTTHKDNLTIKRRLAQACSKAVRQKAIQSQKTTKESAWRAKRLTREMQAFWRLADRAEKENKKRLEKEEEELRKINVEAQEAKRVQQNLNFLITQTEYYAHCTTGNIEENPSPEIVTQTILERLRGPSLESHEVESQKIKVKINIQEALEAEKIHIKSFAVNVDGPQAQEEAVLLFTGSLKKYQTLGVNWLTKLYDNGVNGVLADEMGLGKTVQAIAFLAHLAQNYGIWGPFLVIAPASSCHYWEQEIKRFVSKFKIVPYWGNPQERKILRQFWQQTNLHTPEASFHVVVTSYNVVVQDLKYFNKVKWQYLILDEAQSIKSTLSTRWKVLTGFNCRNRVLLACIPTQNQTSIKELLSLLHFVLSLMMPSLFISQEDCTEWLSKDGEDGGLGKSYLARLYAVLQQFMLRRTKKDVESELCDKIELFVPCPLTTRQRFFHAALDRKIIVEDLLKIGNASASPPSPSSFSLGQDGRNLLSLVMQFRKVCNHPDLFERRDMKSPFFMDKILLNLPKLLYQNQVDGTKSWKDRFSIFNPANIHSASVHHQNGPCISNNRRIRAQKTIEDLHIANVAQTEDSFNEWSFIRFSGLGITDVYKIACGGIVERMTHLVEHLNAKFLQRQYTWWRESSQRDGLHPSEFLISNSFLSDHQNFVFTSATQPFYRWEVSGTELDDEQKSVILLPKNEPCTRKGPLVALHMPKFMFNLCPKVKSYGLTPYLSNASSCKWMQRNSHCSPEECNLLLHASLEGLSSRSFFSPRSFLGLLDLEIVHGWSDIVMPDKERLVTDSGKMTVLDGLLKNLNQNGHRVLIYSLIPKMMDLLEEYFRYRKYSYIRADGQKSATDLQMKPDTFAILLNSARAAFMGYDLSEIDTIIFYDSDSTTPDQQMIDLADRLSQTGSAKQVTVYQLFCKGTLEERMLRKIRHKNENKTGSLSDCPQTAPLGSEALTHKEILSLLLDDDELDRKYRQRHLDKKVGDRFSERRSAPATSHQSQSSQSVTASAPPSQASNLVNGNAGSGVHLKSGAAASSGGSCQSQEFSPSSQEGYSDEMDCDMKDVEFDVTLYEEDPSECNPSSSDYFDNYSRAIEWNNGSTSDYEEDLPFIPKKPKLGRGTGKRGRPPSRVRVQMRDLSVVGGDLSMRRGPGRPRLKPIGPLNQGIRGRRPGRPPLSKKAETISPTCPPIYGLYNGSDLNLSSS